MIKVTGIRNKPIVEHFIAYITNRQVNLSPILFDLLVLRHTNSGMCDTAEIDIILPMIQTILPLSFLLYTGKQLPGLCLRIETEN